MFQEQKNAFLEKEKQTSGSTPKVESRLKNKLKSCKLSWYRDVPSIRKSGQFIEAVKETLWIWEAEKLFNNDRTLGWMSSLSQLSSKQSMTSCREKFLKKPYLLTIY